MKKIRELFGLDHISIFLISLPYLIFNYNNIVHSPFFSHIQLIGFLFGLILMDILIIWIFNSVDKNKTQMFSLLIGYGLMLFFYGFYFTNYLQKIINETFDIVIRGRLIIGMGMLNLVLLFYLFRNQKISFKYFNFFFLFFSLITIITSIEKENEKKLDKFKNNYIHIIKRDSLVKPVILIISDEYTSPIDLFNVYADSNLFRFSDYLKKNKWAVKNSFFSYETKTIISLGSLFNFNLSKDKNFSDSDTEKNAARLFNNAALIDSLINKQIKIINLGIFNLGASKPLNIINFFEPKTFLQDILSNTIYYKLILAKLFGFSKSFYPMQVHNKYLFNTLVDTLYKNNDFNAFAYVHLYMPHSPMQYYQEFPLLEDYNLNNYLNYWNFTNLKLQDLLEDLIKGNRFRIILTGDHGYRNDKRINAHFTFAAFYGFDKPSLDSIKSVQDLGSLINGGY